MSRTNRNFVIAYVVLVGLPLAGLAGVLRAGRSLAAPISVDGTWKVEADTSRVGPAPCSQAITALSNSSLLISQSGKSLILTFSDGPRSVSAGVLNGRTMSAPLMLEPSSGSGCMAAQAMTLVAAVDEQAEPRTLSGSFSLNDCPSCGPITFRAVRLPRAKKDGGH
ncbi:MAG TPA: hypothetical protein VKQ11_12405 [Candidatus Sulfotelmatobacter sp.]|nr:hypothetical protein [Candidatus Sulfotelmatobacter sp.]